MTKIISKTERNLSINKEGKEDGDLKTLTYIAEYRFVNEVRQCFIDL